MSTAATVVFPGRPRFSGYSVVVRVEEAEAGRASRRAETRAEFPHLKGAVYKTLVIGTRMHVLVTRRILAAVKARAERP